MWCSAPKDFKRRVVFGVAVMKWNVAIGVCAHVRPLTASTQPGGQFEKEFLFSRGG